MKPVALRTHSHRYGHLPHARMLLAMALLLPCFHAVADESDYGTEAFAREIERTLPREAPTTNNFPQAPFIGPVEAPTLLPAPMKWPSQPLVGRSNGIPSTPPCSKTR